MKNLKYLVLVIAVLLLTSCAGRDWYHGEIAGRDWYHEEMSDAEIDMHFKKVNEIEPAAGNNSILKELMKPRVSVLDFLE